MELIAQEIIQPGAAHGPSNFIFYHWLEKNE